MENESTLSKPEEGSLDGGRLSSWILKQGTNVELESGDTNPNHGGQGQVPGDLSTCAVLGGQVDKGYKIGEEHPEP